MGPSCWSRITLALRGVMSRTLPERIDGDFPAERSVSAGICWIVNRVPCTECAEVLVACLESLGRAMPA